MKLLRINQSNEDYVRVVALGRDAVHYLGLHRKQYEHLDVEFAHQAIDCGVDCIPREEVRALMSYQRPRIIFFKNNFFGDHNPIKRTFDIGCCKFEGKNYTSLRAWALR